MPNEIDQNTINMVMNLSPDELTGRPDLTDVLIAYYRKARAHFLAGGKPMKGEAQKVDLASIGLGKKEVAVRRRKV